MKKEYTRCVQSVPSNNDAQNFAHLLSVHGDFQTSRLDHAFMLSDLGVYRWTNLEIAPVLLFIVNQNHPREHPVTTLLNGFYEHGKRLPSWQEVHPKTWRNLREQLPPWSKAEQPTSNMTANTINATLNLRILFDGIATHQARIGIHSGTSKTLDEYDQRRRATDFVKAHNHLLHAWSFMGGQARACSNALRFYQQDPRTHFSAPTSDDIMDQRSFEGLTRQSQILPPYWDEVSFINIFIQASDLQTKHQQRATRATGLVLGTALVKHLSAKRSEARSLSERCWRAASALRWLEHHCSP